jgi:hypothetical protein
MENTCPPHPPLSPHRGARLKVRGGKCEIGDCPIIYANINKCKLIRKSKLTHHRRFAYEGCLHSRMGGH